VYLKPGGDCTEALARRGLVAERGSSKIALNCGFTLKQADRSVIEPRPHVNKFFKSFCHHVEDCDADDDHDDDAADEWRLRASVEARIIVVLPRRVLLLLLLLQQLQLQRDGFIAQALHVQHLHQGSALQTTNH